MADSAGAWGIDIGQAGLKAIRLRYADAAEQAIAVAFDYIPHPKILSQPDAVPEEIIQQSLAKFLERNPVKGDRIAISVSGQSALARFIQLPPVESGKVRDIVKFEARQQIPFALEEVIWDYQPIGAPQEEGGFLLNAEVGLFAMKRDQVADAMEPFQDRKVEVDLVQIAPLCLYNFLSYDRLGIRVSDEAVDFDEWTIVLDMGADATTLLVSNGAKIWIRNVPIGGNHFTRALTKDMKLTFAKAEHLKCNATKSPDPRAVFQALRPVFNDYVSEIQRSIGFFSSANRDAKITKILGVGNGFKLAGLQRFLQQNLQYEVERVENFSALVGDTVLNQGLFQDNIMTFVVPYGLAIQALEQTRIHTSLLPPEIVVERKIRAKKPWAAAAAAILLGCMGTSAALHARVPLSASEEKFGAQEKAAAAVASDASTKQNNYNSAVGTYESITEEGKTLQKPLKPGNYWKELYKAINEAAPRDVGNQKLIAQLQNENPTKSKRIRIKSITTEFAPSLGEWYSDLTTQNQSAMQYMAKLDRDTAPEGAGYIVTLETEHFHHEEDNQITGQGVPYLVDSFLRDLQKWTLVDAASGAEVPVGKLGISHATIVQSFKIEEIPFLPESKRRKGAGLRGGFGIPGGRGGFGNRSGFGNEEGSGVYAPSSGSGYDENYQGRGSGGSGFPIPGLPNGEQEEVEMIPRTRATIQFLFKPIPEGDRTDPEPETDESAEAPTS